MKRMQYNIKSSVTAILLLMLAGGFRWLFRGILDSIKLEIVIAFLGFLFLFAGEYVKLNKNQMIWIPYILAIGLNIVYHRLFTGDIILYAILLFEICIFSFLINTEVTAYSALIKLMIINGLFNGTMIIVHFFMGDMFLDLYGVFLTPLALDLAEHYSGYGHYFGVNYFPADAAGTVAVSLFLLIYQAILTPRKNPLLKYGNLIVGLLLFIPLLLTGKKGILFCAIFAFTFLLAYMYWTHKRFVKLITFALALVLFGFAGWGYIVTHQDNPLFIRLAQFIHALNTGGNYSSSRFGIWARAFLIWQSQPLFGIGWRQFGNVSTQFYTRPHEVNCDYLQLLTELGLFGFVLVMIPTVVMFYRTLKAYKFFGKTKSISYQYRIIVMSAAFIQIFFLMYAVLEIPFYDYTFFTMYILSCLPINRAYADMKHMNTDHC